MKHTLLLTALLLGLGTASAAEPVPAGTDDSVKDGAARIESTRAELAELRTQMRELSGRMAKLSTELGDVGPRTYALRYLGDPDRALVGLVLAQDPKGARISAVTPDGPAARAGLRDGDVIVAVDGRRIANAKDPGDGLREARERLGNLKEGQEVRLAWERGAKAQPELTLKAARRAAFNWPQVVMAEPGNVVRIEDLDKETRAHVDRALDAARSIDHEKIRADTDRAMRRAEVAMRRAMPWWGLNLVPLNPDLGRYFGADRGALVVSANASAGGGLRGGDVITEVAGEKISDPGDAMRALRDQPAEREVPLKVLRERKTLTLNVKAPEYQSIFSVPPVPPLPPAPPSPRTPAAPPSPPAPPSGPADET